MKSITLLVLATTALAHLPSHAQFVRGNEAVQSNNKIETPPVPASASKVCEAKAECHAGAWHMVESSAGLRECTEPFARSGSCRNSTYGIKKLPRLWIVKVGGTWKWCQYPDLTRKCVDMFAKPPANLPVDAVQ